MNQINLSKFIKEKKIVIPISFLRMYQTLDLSVDELILLLYLFDLDKSTYDPSLIALDLECDFMKVMMNISSLSDKGLININTVKNERGIMEEVVDLSGLFDKMTLLWMEKLNQSEDGEINIHKLIEEEFHRELSPLEHEMIEDWENNGFHKELIKAAVKEASINGVSNLRYIDKILIDWNKLGYKLPSDIQKHSSEVKEKIEVFNCDWLNDDEEI